MYAAAKTRVIHRFAHSAKGWGIVRRTAVLMFTLSSVMFCLSASAQSDFDCSLGKISERMPPEYPFQLQGRIVQGDVSILATFAPDGHVSASKAISGPQPLQFEARAYLNGWRAEASSAPRQCVIHLEYRFDGPQTACSSRRDVRVRPERLSETNVLLHLSCDTL
jgi:hypothetical protein